MKHQIEFHGHQNQCCWCIFQVHTLEKHLCKTFYQFFIIIFFTSVPEVFITALQDSHGSCSQRKPMKTSEPTSLGYKLLQWIHNTMLKHL